MTSTSDTVRTHLQRCRTLGEGLLKLCAHQSPYTGRTHRLFPSPQAASVRPRFEPTATPPSRAISQGCYRCANLASFPGSPSFRAIIPCMTFDPPQRKAEGEPGRFCHMTRVMKRHPYIRYRHEPCLCLVLCVL